MQQNVDVKLTAEKFTQENTIFSAKDYLRRVLWGKCNRVRHFLVLCSAIEVLMAEFVIEREIPGIGNLSEAELREVASKSVMILNELGPQIKWLHSYVTGDKLYCVYMAPDEELIKEHARRGGFPANRVSAVRRLIDPSTAK